MKNTSVRPDIPKYRLSEELLNAISHGVGALFGVAALVLCIVKSLRAGEAVGYRVVASSVFGSTVILLYLMSCLYHSLKVNRAKYVFRIIDHCTIFLLIAGSYAPFSLVALRSVRPSLGWTVFGVIWVIAVVGVVLNAVDLKRFSKISVVCYLVMGWMIIFSYNDLRAALPARGIRLLVAGGIAYTVGAVLYAIGSKKPYFHSVFHFFCVAGTVLHFFSVYFYVL